MKIRIRLDTMRDMNQFVNACSKITCPVHITDGAGLKVSAKSLLGVIYAMEFEEIWCECEEDIYSLIEGFVVL
jgi:hypothetical protein